MHLCLDDLTINGSDNGLVPGQCQAIIRTSAGILLIGPLQTNFFEILIEILTFSFKKMRLKVRSAKWRPYCLGLIELVRHFIANQKQHVVSCCVGHQSTLRLWDHYTLWGGIVGFWYKTSTAFYHQENISLVHNKKWHFYIILKFPIGCPAHL